MTETTDAPPEHWQSTCPFTDPKFQMDPEKPCPVCGDLGTFASLDDDSNCAESKQ